MKIVGLIFLMLGFAAWSVRTPYAGQSVAASQQAPSRSAANAVGNHARDAEHLATANAATHTGKPFADQQNHRKVSSNKPSTSNTSPSKTNHGNEASSGGERSVRDGSKDSHRPASDRSAGAAQNGLARNFTVTHAPSDRAPGAVRPAVPSLNNVRHHGANPPIIGGPGNSDTRNTAALDGTHMNRKRTGN
jgi:hypothetical protein